MLTPSTNMQLKLSIERKSCQGRWPTAQVVCGQLTQTFERDVCVNVTDSDCVFLHMTGKDYNDTVVGPDGAVLEDVAVILDQIELGGVDFGHCVDQLPYRDHNHTALPSNRYMSKNGYIVIDIAALLQMDYQYSNIQYLTLDQVAQEVLGRPLNTGQAPQVNLHTESARDESCASD